MKVRRVFHRNAVCIEGWESVNEAARRMAAGGFSCLPVLSGGELVGIITERDLVEALANNERPWAATVFEYMSETPKTIDLDAECSEAATEMLSAGCRHLPVMDGTKLVGVVSARDLLPLAAAGAA